MASNGQSKTELSDQDLELISLLQWAPRITWGEAAEILTHTPPPWPDVGKTAQPGAAWITAQVNLNDPGNPCLQEISATPGAVAPAWSKQP